jgi:hypothetical protein
LIDEEYAEHVSVYQSVFRAHWSKQQKFTVGEFGARWGTWGARAVALWRNLNPASDYDAFFVESDPLHCEGLRQVMSINEISYTLKCELADSGLLTSWLESKSSVDLLDLDIQRAELETLRTSYEAVSSKVKRLIVGTHSSEIHKNLLKLFSSWIIIYDVPYSTDTSCIAKNLRRNYDSTKEIGWDELIEKKCYTDTVFGPVANWDGEIVIDNPAFVEREKSFSMSDDTAKIDDLLT